MAKALKDAIDNAKGIADNKNVTAEQVAGALAALQEARAKAGADILSYFCLSSSGSTWAEGSDAGLVFVFKRNDDVASAGGETTFRHFLSASVDGKALVKDKDYTAVEGSVVVTLMPSFLKTLSAGEHTLTATFDDGECSATFIVEAATTRGDAAEEPSTKTDGAAEEPSAKTDAATKASSAKTGDALPVVMLAVSAILSLAVLLASRTRVRKAVRGKRGR